MEKNLNTASEIKKDVFQEHIPLNGILLLMTTIYLDTMKAGWVEVKFVDDRIMMKEGQPILKFLNTDLQLQQLTQINKY